MTCFQILVLTIVVVVLTLFYKYVTQRFSIDRAEQKHGCSKAVKYPHKEPIFGLDLFFRMGKAMKEGRILETNRNLFDTYGKTFEVNSWGTATLNTCDPRNIQTVLALSFKNFGKVKVKLTKKGGSFMAEGIFTADGEIWQRSRALIRPTFARSEISNFECLNKHVNKFMDRISTDSSIVDLQPLLKDLFLDISTEFIFGKSVDCQTPNPPFDSSEFLRAFDISMSGLGARMMLGKLKFIRGRDLEWKKAFKTVHEYIDSHVSTSLIARGISKDSKTEECQQKKFVLLEEMTKETQDPIDLRYQLLHIFIPAHDATGIAVSDIFYHLSRDTRCWDKLREEVLRTTASEPISFELLKSTRYLRHVFNESLRLHPNAGIVRRVCLQDTILPSGGGTDGLSPVLIRRGSNIVLNHHVLHRDRDFWGHDADEFRPERWKNLRPTWEYLPFSGGPRICPAQQMVFTDSAYIIVRMVQTFARIENQDPLSWSERFRMTVENKNGVKVRFFTN
ncbi:hypothetical protein HYFRA_00010519 [Hymenoscyphus fraxineus]|uniref:Cytochrome P450 n=1 Tax=Hymenoscyphus fraxineus TaxID=746836 RepID=A0A9N9PXI0_9HELO|nr:hypothetical protein HYFRA_00010519 [Hymenoscyphus fraxineus]